MAKVLGWDIGGANIKAVYLQTSNGAIKKIVTVSEYFPIWKNPKKLSSTLKRLHGKLTPSNLDAVGATMTAELSDAYRNKREGVNHILDCLEKIFHNVPLYIVDVGGWLISPSKARHNPLRVSSANWAASGWLASQLLDNCILIDVGSTTTTIIPIVKGQVVAEGLTDLGKLSNGELVYTGSLRTNIATVVDFIPLRGRKVWVSSELFATTADVHLLLNNISADKYTVETADGRGKTKVEAASRIVRAICADTTMLTAGEIKEIARYVAEQQVNQIAEAFREVLNRCRQRGNVTETIIITGIGKNFLARKAAERCGCKEILDFSKLASPEASKVTPALATALMAADKVEKVKLKSWLTP